MKINQREFITKISLTLVIPLALGGCWNSQSSLSPPAKDELVVGLVSSSCGQSVRDLFLPDFTRGYLVRVINSNGGISTVSPWLAESWEVDSSRKVFKFRLSKTAPRAGSIVLSIKKNIQETSFEGLGFVPPLKNLKEFKKGSVPFEEVGVKNEGDDIVRFDLDKPFANFPMLAAFPPFGSFEGTGGFVQKNNDGQKNVWSTTKGFERKIKYNSLRVECLGSESNALNSMESGNVHLVLGLPKRYNSSFFPKSQVYYLSLSSTLKPTSNPIFRRALSMSIDREEMAKNLPVQLKYLSSFLPWGVEGFESNRGMRLDPAEAQALLKRSGFRDLNKVSNIKIYGGDPLKNQIAEEIKKQIKSHLLMDAEITDDPKVATIWISEFDEKIPAPEIFLQMFTSQSPLNLIKYKNREYDELVRKLHLESDSSDRLHLLSKAQHQLIEEDIPMIPLFAGMVGAWHSPKVRYFDFYSFGRPQLESVTIK